MKKQSSAKPKHLCSLSEREGTRDSGPEPGAGRQLEPGEQPGAVNTGGA